MSEICNQGLLVEGNYQPSFSYSVIKVSPQTPMSNDKMLRELDKKCMHLRKNIKKQGDFLAIHHKRCKMNLYQMIG
ncbi:MAG: hypothetical protein ACK5JH_05790 [Anaerocolumna sp.]